MGAASHPTIEWWYKLSDAHHAGCRQLKKAHVRAAISEKLGKTFDRLDISVERTLEELARIAYGNAADLVDMNDLGDWQFNLASLDDRQRTLLKSMKKGENGKTEVTTHDMLW